MTREPIERFFKNLASIRFLSTPINGFRVDGANGTASEHLRGFRTHPATAPLPRSARRSLPRERRKQVLQRLRRVQF
jgi:hypothetical protein